MRVFAYLRVSTESQVESGLGLRAQEDACRRWARQYGTDIDALYVDDAISGSTPYEKRPALINAIQHLKPDDYLVVARMDRLGRDIANVAMIVKLIGQKKAKFISVAESKGETGDPAAVMFLQMVVVFAEYERNLIGERVKKAIQTKKERNEHLGHIPYGMRISDDGLHLEENQDEKAIIEEIKSLRGQGFSVRKISKTFESRSIGNRGTSWKPVAIWKLLKRFDNKK